MHLARDLTGPWTVRPSLKLVYFDTHTRMNDWLAVGQNNNLQWR